MQPTLDSVRDSFCEFAPNVHPADISKTIIGQQLADMTIAASHEASYELLRRFNEFCDDNAITYFALSTTLVGAIAYEDFVPGNVNVDIGMLRADYEAFEQAYYRSGGAQSEPSPYPDAAEYITAMLAESLETRIDLVADDDTVEDITNSLNESELGKLIDRAKRALRGPGNSEDALTAIDDLQIKSLSCVRFCEQPQGAVPFGLVTHSDPARKHHVCEPLVQLPGFCLVLNDGRAVYGMDHLPIAFGVKLTISVLDAIPDDYDFARYLFRRLKGFDEACGLLPDSVEKLWGPLRNRAWELAASYNGREHRSVAKLVPRRGASMPIGSLTPARKVSFGSASISVPADPSAWIVADPENQRAQTELLQHDVKQVIAEIDRICRENDIGYFICGGTMLGYVRHGGFIPWDDDMDIGMLREDYDKFLAIAPAALDEQRFFLQTRSSDPLIPYLFSKMRLRNSEYITSYNQFRNFDKGICVDIFPFDKVPFETGDMPQFTEDIRKLVRDHNRLANRQVGDMPSTETQTLTDKVAREVMSFRHERYRSRSLADTQRAFEEKARSFNGRDDLSYVASFVPSFTMVNVDDLLPYQDAAFDDLTLKAPAHPEVFLRMQYGDFMAVPLPHQQRGHNLIWWSDAEHDAADFGGARPEHAPVAHHASTLAKALPALAAAGAALGCAGCAAAIAKRIR